MATASARRRARRTANEARNPEFRVPPKECEMCGCKMSGKDRHRACVLCLGPEHAIRGLRERGAFCLLCGDTETRYLRRRLFRSQGQDFASDPLGVVKDQEAGPPEPIPQLAQSTVSTPPARSRGEGGTDHYNMDGDLLLQTTANHSALPVPVFTKGASTTTSSLINQLKGITDTIIGLDYVREFRSSTESAPPHYQCTLCGVRAMERLQNDHEMLTHIKSWRHAFKYIKRVHPIMFTCEEEDAERSSKIRMSIRETAAEVEQAEGRGQLEIILKEPCDVPAFKGMQSAIPKMGQGMGPNGGYAARSDSTELDMGPRQFPDGMGHHNGGGDGFGHHGRSDDFGMSGQLEEEFRGSQMGSRLLDGPTDQPGLKGSRLDPDSSSIRSTLLNLLDTVQIQNESDARIVHKLAKKLTDVLMEYRRRTGSTVPSMSSSLNNSPPSRMPGAGDRYSGGFSGPSRYPDGPSRFYN